MKYTAFVLALFPVFSSAACLLPDDVESFLEYLDTSHFASLDTQVDTSRPEMLRYRFAVEEGVTGSFVWCWRTALTKSGIEVDCLSGGVMGVSTDPNQSEQPEIFLEEEQMIWNSFDGVGEDYEAFVKKFDIEPELVELSPAPASYCDIRPASNKSQQETGG